MAEIVEEVVERNRRLIGLSSIARMTVGDLSNERDEKARVGLDADTLDGLHADEIIRLGRMGGGGGGAGEAAVYVDVVVPANGDSVVVGHALGKVPDAVLPEPQDDLGGRSFWVTGKTLTEFTFHISSLDPESDHSFRCRVC
jgi:hypothetical protein